MVTGLILRMVIFSTLIGFSSCIYGAESTGIAVGSNVVPAHGSLKLTQTGLKVPTEYPALLLTQLMVTRFEGKTVYLTGKLAGVPFEGSAAEQDVALTTTKMPTSIKIGDRQIPIEQIDAEARELFKQKMLALYRSERGRSIRTKYELQMMQRRAHALATAGFWLEESERRMQLEIEQFIDAEIVLAAWCQMSREEKLLVASSSVAPPDFLKVMLRVVPLDGSVTELTFEEFIASLEQVASEQQTLEQKETSSR